MAGREYPGDDSNAAEVIGCSVRGQKNAEKDIPCQDGHEKRVLPNQRYVIAAADGLGSASLSHVGSQTATQAVVEYVEESLPATGVLDAETLRPLLASAFVHAREQIREQAAQLGEPVSNLNTTLLVAVGGPAGVAGAAVGDGGVVCHRGGQTGLVISREDTEYENETIPLQSDDWNESYRFGWVPDADAAAVFSDGLDGVAWDGPRSVSDQLFDQVFGNVRDFSDLTELEMFLSDFLDSESLRKSSRDDKTLVVGALPSSEWAEGTAVGSQVGLSASGGDTDSPEDGGETNPADTGGIAGSARAGTGSGGGASGAPGQQPTDVGTYGGTASGPDDERLGRSQRSRNVLRIGAVAVGVVVVALLVGFLFLGGDEGGESERTIDIETAELRGERGLVVNISDIGESTSPNVSVVEVTDEVEVARSDNITTDNGTLETELEPTEFEDGFDYYGDTDYRVSVEVGDTAANTPLKRGELELGINATSDDDGPGPEGSIALNVTVTQGGFPAHEVRLNNISLDQASTLARADKEGEGGEFSFRPARSDEAGDDETTIIAEFEGAVGRTTVKLLDPAVVINEGEPVIAGEDREFSATAFDEFGSQIDNPTFDWEGENEVISPGGDFSENRAGTYNITVESVDTNATSEMSVTVEAAEPDDVDIKTQPKVTATGNAIRGSPAVNVTDGFENPVEGVEVTVSADNASVSGETANHTDEDGVATFENVNISEPGEYNLTFAAEGVEEDAETRLFDVRTPSNISVSEEPGNTNVSEEMRPSPAANVTDEDGDAVPGVDVTVTATATDEDGSSIEVVGDTTVPTDNSGIATFDNLAFEQDGEYTLTFTVSGMDDISTTTGSFEVENGEMPGESAVNRR